MRGALLTLLLINLLVLVWYNWVDVAPRTASTPPVENAAEGQVVGSSPDEMDDVVRDDSSAVPNGDVSAIADIVDVEGMSPETCFIGGSYETTAAAQVLIDDLALSNVRAEVRTAVGEEWNGHWVRAIGFRRKDSARAAIARLKSAGIDDGYALQDADGEGWIVSLGIFKNSESVDAVTIAARSAGLDVEVRDRYKSIGVFRVMVYADAAQLVPLGEPDFVAGGIETPCDNQL